MKKSTCMMIGTILLTGCSSTIWVHEKETGSKDKAVSAEGIPFYVKVEKYEQNTKYSQAWIEATLKIDLVDNDGNKTAMPPITRYLSKAQMQVKEEREKIDNLVNEIANNKVCYKAKYDEILADFFKISKASPDLIDVEMNSNIIKSVWVVDGSKTYYLNAPLPWFGKNTFSHTLNSDGTLATAQSAPDTQLAQGISTFLPVNEIVTNTLSAGGNVKGLTMPSERNGTAKVKYQISIGFVENGYIYTYIKQFDTKPDILEPINPGKDKAYYIREPLVTRTAETSEKSDDKSIGFNGKITLPK